MATDELVPASYELLADGREVKIVLQKTEFTLSADQLVNIARSLLQTRAQMKPVLPPMYDVNTMNCEWMAESLTVLRRTGGKPPAANGGGLVLRTEAGYVGFQLSADQARWLVDQLTAESAAAPKVSVN